MNKNVQPIPPGFHAVTPYLCVRDAARAIEFYKRAFAARELERMPTPDGRIAHAEISIGDSIVMLSDENPEWGNQSPETLNGSAVGLALYVDNVDEVFRRAVQAGAKETEPVADRFWGDRSGSVTDPFGHKWMLLTHVEDVPPEEMKQRMASAMAEMRHEHDKE